MTEQANADIFNFVAFGAVLRAALKPGTADEVISEFLLNTDVAAVFFKQEGEKTRIAPNMRHPHNAVDMPLVTIGLIPTVAARGNLVCMLIFIKDHNFKEPTLVQVLPSMQCKSCMTKMYFAVLCRSVTHMSS